MDQNSTAGQRALRPDGHRFDRHRNREILKVFNTFFHNESTAGVLLLICAVIAVTFASMPGGERFARIWDAMAGFSIGDFSMEMSVRHWVNDGLMAIFFFVVGLEIKREMLVGQLSSIKRSVLPIVAAIGGMLVPAGIYLAFNAGRPESFNGWGIPMATDIAFAIGILSLLGNRVPAGLKVFLTALAIVDDLGAIIVLAIFYPTHALHLDCLLYVVIILGVLVLFNLAKVKNKYMYILPGILMWYFTYKSGVHATIAGVLLAMVIPSKGNINELRFHFDPGILFLKACQSLFYRGLLSSRAPAGKFQLNRLPFFFLYHFCCRRLLRLRIFRSLRSLCIPAAAGQHARAYSRRYK